MESLVKVMEEKVIMVLASDGDLEDLEVLGGLVPVIIPLQSHRYSL